MLVTSDFGMMKISINRNPHYLCALQRNGSLTEYPQFQHCKVQKYKNDYEPDHHVKACLGDPDVSVLWETGHCHHNTTSMEPLFSLQKEGLLFCVATPISFSNW